MNVTQYLLHIKNNCVKILVAFSLLNRSISKQDVVQSASHARTSDRNCPILFVEVRISVSNHHFGMNLPALIVCVSSASRVGILTNNFRDSAWDSHGIGVQLNLPSTEGTH